jgi:hypothetical protein
MVAEPIPQTDLSVFWAKRFPNSKVKAEVAADALKAIRARRGEITPELVVEEARSKRSPLHKMFIWDDATAAHEYRLARARNIIGALMCFVAVQDDPENPEPVRVFAHLVEPGEEEDRSFYLPVKEALLDGDHKKQITYTALKELEGWARRWRIYSALAPFVNAAEMIIKTMSKKLPKDL